MEYKIGDKVKIVKKYEGDDGPSWIYGMDSCIGETGRVVRCSDRGNYRVENGDCGYYYHPKSLELICEFKIGDKVRISRKIRNGLLWTDMMDETIGKEGVVGCVDSRDCRVTIGTTMYWYDQACLELVYGFKKGDRVRIVRRWDSPYFNWHPEMGKTVGAEGVIVCMHSHGYSVRVEKKVWLYDANSLEFIEPIKKDEYHFWVNHGSEIDDARICREAPKDIDVIRVDDRVLIRDSFLARITGCQVCLRKELLGAGWGQIVCGVRPTWRMSWYQDPDEDVEKKIKQARDWQKNRKKIMVKYL